MAVSGMSARRGFETVNVASVAVFVATALVGCRGAPSSVPDAAEWLLCPELSRGVDLLQVSYSTDPAANGRIRAFVSAARGLYDVSVEMERLAADACRRMSHDLGYPDPPPGARLDQLCAPLKTSVEGLKASGVEIRISVAPPHCGADAERGSRCDSACASSVGDAECNLLCRAQSELYARCSLPSVTVAASSSVEVVVRLARTIEENLPSLLYAEMAMGRRLVQHVETIVAMSTHLPNDVKASGERGVACTALAATLTVKAAGRLHFVVDTSAWTTAALNPEVHASNRVAP
jgi:hypothetical protein